MAISSWIPSAIGLTLVGSTAASAETYIVEEARPSRAACYETVYVPARFAVVGSTYLVAPPVRQWRYHDPGHAFADPVSPSEIVTVPRLRVVEREHHVMRPIDCR